jgi:hypothetical protein
MATQVTIDHVENAPVPTILIGFSSPDFSQAVYLAVDSDPLKCVEMANQLAQQFIDACGRAVKGHKATLSVVPDTFKGDGS